MSKAVGAISAMNGNTITVKKDDGSEVNVQAQESTRLARVAPGQKDLKSATPIQLRDLQVGDRILVRGSSSDEKTIMAATVLVMKKGDVEAKKQTERQDWQHRGIGGLVTSVDTDTGTVTISTTGFTGKKTIAVRTAKNTVFRRYAPDSVKFDDARISTLEQIKPGDQLRARGDRNADGTELAADEIVSGSFRNIAGTVTTTDSNRNTITLADLVTKKPVVVKISGDSQVRKLPPEMAQHIALRLKAMNGSPGQPPAAAMQNSTTAGDASSPAAAGRRSGMGSGGRAGGPPDFQQMLNRLSPATIADFQKGDAIMVVSTEGVGAGPVTAITLLGGVEPILAAAPSGGEPMRLSPWSLGSGGGEEASQ
jgi:co-chaperonin GroES (HSP10)